MIHLYIAYETRRKKDERMKPIYYLIMIKYYKVYSIFDEFIFLLLFFRSIIF